MIVNNREQEFHRLRSIETDECVAWPYAKTSAGYGKLNIGGRYLSVHRLALALATGEEPDGMYAAHGPCNKRACMNPRHLRWATPAENSNDRHRDGTLYRGPRRWAKLTEEQVIEIRTSTERSARLAERFGVSDSTICNIRKGKIWRDRGVVAEQEPGQPVLKVTPIVADPT
jgi:hypothetical protein